MHCCFRLSAHRQHVTLLFDDTDHLTNGIHLSRSSENPTAVTSDQDSVPHQLQRTSTTSFDGSAGHNGSANRSSPSQSETYPVLDRLPERWQRYARLALSFWSGPFVWVAPSSQVVLGLLLLYLVIWLTLPQLYEWWLALVPVVFGLGVVGGMGIGRQVGVTWSASGGQVSVGGLARGLLMLVPVFVLRFVIGQLVRQGMTSLAPLRDLLFFFVPGMLTTRGLVLIAKLVQQRQRYLKR